MSENPFDFDRNPNLPTTDYDVAVRQSIPGMESQRLSEVVDGVWQNIQCISEERTLELLAQAGFTKVTRFYTGFIFAGWFAFTE